MDERHAAVTHRLHVERLDARRRFQVDTLVGVAEQDARQRVIGAGGRFETFPADNPEAAMTADLRLDRVRAYVRDGRVVYADVG